MSAVLDASALLALLASETGAGVVLSHLDDASISAVNLAEVAGKLDDVGMPEPIIRRVIEALPVHVADFDREQALTTGLLRSKTRDHGLSLGDRACLSLGIQRQAVVVTADASWADLELPVEVLVIR